MSHVLDARQNPALGEILREVRSAELQRDRHRFRGNLKLLGTILAYEVGAALDGRAVEVETPLGSRAVDVLAGPPVLATAMRAGLPFLDGFQEVFRTSDVMFFGAARAEDGGGPDGSGAMRVVLDYAAFADCRGRPLVFVDPMVATGSTILNVHAALVARDLAPSRFIVAGLVGYAGAVERIEAAIPNADVWFVTCDDELDGRGYIVPGLGDAGDLCYGEKA